MAGATPRSPASMPPLQQLATVLVEEPPPATAHSSIVTLINSAVGAGVLALPYAFRCTGWAAGLVCMAAVAAVESFTLYVLARSAEATGTKTYGALVYRALGKRAGLAMCTLIVLFLFGGCVSYLMILGDSFHPLLTQAFGSQWWTSRNAAIIAVGCTCIFPLCLRTTLGGLHAASSLAVTAILVVVGAVCYSSARRMRRPDHPWEAVKAFNPSLQFFGALPLIIFSFVCHQNVISVFTELEDRPLIFRHAANHAAATGSAGQHHRLQQQQQQQQTTPEPGASSYQSLPSPRLLAHRSMRQLKSYKLCGMVWVIIGSMGVVAALNSAVGLAGYLAFPADAHSDILVSFGSTNPMMQVARTCIGLVLIASYPVVHFPARAALQELLHHTTSRHFSGAVFNAMEAVAFFGSSLAIAVNCTDLGVVFQLIGGTCGSLLVLSIPGALLINFAYSKHRVSWQQVELLREPLLALAAQEGGCGSGGTSVQPSVYSFWWSKLFWTGAALQVLAAAVAALTIWTIVWEPASL